MYADLAFENCELSSYILIIRHVAYASAELIKSRKAVVRPSVASFMMQTIFESLA